MYDIEVLEKEWKRYNRKKVIPWIIAIFFIVIVSMVSIFLLNKDIQLLSFFKDDNNSKVTSQKMIRHEIILDGPLIKVENKKVSVHEETPLVEVSSENDNNRDNITVQKRNQIQIKVFEADDPKAFKEVEKRFRLSHDVDDSLFLAKSYYAKRQYKKAEYWALQTNKVDEGIEESWLIFVKAKAKRGQKNEALRILNTYIKRTHSSEAKVLLEKIKKGEF